MVSTVKLASKKKGRGRKKAAGGAKPASDKIALSSLIQAKKMAESLGGVEKAQVALAALEAAGLKVDDLQCGAAWPLYIQFEDIFPVAQDQLDPLRNDCSGKHAGFLALAKFLSEPLDDCLKPESRIQKMIRESVAAAKYLPIE